MHTEIVKSKISLPTDYDPEEGLKTILISEASEKFFRQAKDVSALYAAVETKIDAQAYYIVWRDGVMKVKDESVDRNANSGQFTAGQSGGPSWLPEADPGKNVAYHWREKFTRNISANGARHTVRDEEKIASAKQEAKERCRQVCEGVSVKEHSRGAPTTKKDDIKIKTERTVRVLALDLMSKIGFAYRTNEGPVNYGTHDFQPKDTKAARAAHKSVEQTVTIFDGKKKNERKNEARGIRWKRFREWLDATMEVFDPTAIYFEAVTGFNPKANGRDARIYWCFEAILTGWCEERRIPYYPIPAGTIKKAETGRGDATKDMMMASVRQRGYEPQDDNAADALALLNYAEKSHEKSQEEPS